MRLLRIIVPLFSLFFLCEKLSEALPNEKGKNAPTFILKDMVIARVNETPILLSEVKMRASIQNVTMNGETAIYQEPNQKLLNAALEYQIHHILILEEALKRKFYFPHVSKEKLIESFMSLFLHPDAFQKFMKHTQLNNDELSEYLLNDKKVSWFLEKNLSSKISYTHTDLEQCRSQLFKTQKRSYDLNEVEEFLFHEKFLVETRAYVKNLTKNNSVQILEPTFSFFENNMLPTLVCYQHIENL